MKLYGQAYVVVTDKLRSYDDAMKVIGNVNRQETGRWLNNRGENPHQPFRRREQAMLGFHSKGPLQKFAAVHSSLHKRFNLEPPLLTRQFQAQP